MSSSADEAVDGVEVFDVTMDMFSCFFSPFFCSVLLIDCGMVGISPLFCLIFYDGCAVYVAGFFISTIAWQLGLALQLGT